MFQAPSANDQAGCENETMVVGGFDGGRIFTRAPEAGRGVHDPAWKETKIACLTTFQSQPSDTDPHPELPGCFADQESVGQLVREIKSIRNQTGGRAAIDEQAESEAAATQASDLLEALILPADSDPPGPRPTAARAKNSPPGKSIHNSSIGTPMGLVAQLRARRLRATASASTRQARASVLGSGTAEDSSVAASAEAPNASRQMV